MSGFQASVLPMELHCVPWGGMSPKTSFILILKIFPLHSRSPPSTKWTVNCCSEEIGRCLAYLLLLLRSGREREFQDFILCFLIQEHIWGKVGEPVGFPGGSVVNNPPASAGNMRDAGLIPGSGRSPRGGHGSPLQHSCLKTVMGRGAWQATVDRVTKSWTRLSQ